MTRIVFEKVGDAVQDPQPTFDTQEIVERSAAPHIVLRTYFDAQGHETGNYRRESLRAGDHFEGPAVITEPFSTSLGPTSMRKGTHCCTQ